MDCLVFASILTYAGVTFAIIMIAIVHCFITGSWQSCDEDPSGARLNKTPSLVTEEEVSRFEKLGVWVETKLERTFNWWGRACFRNPGYVMAFGLSISILCSCGLFFMTVTIDPVQLWSSPTSRARLEKDYFDVTFG